MPIEAQRVPGQKLVISVATGDITLDDVRDYFSRIWAEPEYQGYSEIIDWTGAVSVRLSVPELRSLAGAGHAFYGGEGQSKLAIVIDGDEETRLANLYRTLREVRALVYHDHPSLTDETAAKELGEASRKDPNNVRVNRALLEAEHNISEAARLLGVSRPTLYNLLERLGLKS